MNKLVLQYISALVGFLPKIVTSLHLHKQDKTHSNYFHLTSIHMTKSVDESYT